jgi:hypothetical protein
MLIAVHFPAVILAFFHSRPFYHWIASVTVFATALIRNQVLDEDLITIRDDKFTERWRLLDATLFSNDGTW